MQTLTLSPSKSLLSPPHLYLLLLRHPFSSSSPFPTRRRRTDAEISGPRRLYQNHHDSDNNKTVKVSVWWDFENCGIPVGLNVYRVAPRIVSALRSNGIKGPVSVNAFGDVVQLSRSTQDALISTGVSLTHVPHSGKNSSDRSFMADLINWTAQNPAPAHFFLISSDKDFATVLHRLRMNNYNIILSSNDYCSGALCSAATLMLPWGPLVRGEEFCAKYFNYAPDGLYGSWYGYFKGPLDDPFFASEQIPYSQPDEIMEHINETKPRPIPKILVNNILQIINNNPNGIALSTIRDELKRRNILQKDLYGYKKFSNLINSLNNDLTLVPASNGENQPYVYPKMKRVETVDPLEKKPNVVEPVKENFKSETEDNKGILGNEVNKGILENEDNKGIMEKEENKGILGTFMKILFGQDGEEKKDEVPIVAKSEEKDLLVSNPKNKLNEVNNNNNNNNNNDDVNNNNNSNNNKGYFKWILKWLSFRREEDKNVAFITPIPSNDSSPQLAPTKLDKKRDEIISNCHKLVNEMLHQNPKGFDMSLFKPEFEKKFGYTLELKKLGYPKLVNLLQILPGVKLEPNSNRVYKNDTKLESNSNGVYKNENCIKLESNSNRVYKNENGGVKNGDDYHSMFDELGPESKQGVYYKPSLSDEEFSDELDNNNNNNNNNNNKMSPLVQLLDSWYGTKEKDFKELDGLVDCSRTNSTNNNINNNNNNNNNNDNNIKNNNKNLAKIVGLGFKGKNKRVSRHVKSKYNFVSDYESDNEKDKLVDSILGGLKKTGDSRVSTVGKGF